MGGPDVDEVDVQPIDLGQELGEAIELGLEAPPVVAALPVAGQRSGVLYANPLRPVAHRFRVGPSSSGQSLLQVVDLRIRDRDGERADEGRGRWSRGGHCLLLLISGVRPGPSRSGPEGRWRWLSWWNLRRPQP